MSKVLGIDHIAITVSNLEDACAFYDRLFGIEIHAEYAPQGSVLVRQISVGGAFLSIHQTGNGIELVAQHPTIGAADVCLHWGGTIEEAVLLLRDHDIEIIEGPAPRRTADGVPSQSVYFRDLDANLFELMAAD